jgi:hypothetical protein
MERISFYERRIKGPVAGVGLLVLGGGGGFFLHRALHAGVLEWRHFEIGLRSDPIGFWLLFALFLASSLVSLAGGVFLLVTPFLPPERQLERRLRARLENPTPRVEPLPREERERP